jgi:tetratricopeptide (TPR) repeat protein
MLADFYAAIGRLDESVRVYQEIVSKSPDFMMGRYRLTELLLTKGDIQNASVQIEEALKRDKQDRQALMLRARLKSQNGQSDNLVSAIEDLKEVLRQEPNSRAGLYYMAQYHFSLGLLDQARVFASDLEKNYPDFLPAKLMQLQLALTAGDRKAAISLGSDLLARLDKTAPDRENSTELLREIRTKTYLNRGTKPPERAIQTIRPFTTLWPLSHWLRTNPRTPSTRSKRRSKSTPLISTRSMA